MLINPASGRGRVGQHVASVLNGLASRGDQVIALQGESQQEAAALTRQAVADGLDILVAVGGDGTVHLALQAVVGTRTALGIIPLGTGNDGAESVGVPTEMHQAIQTVLAGEAVPFDVGRITSAEGAVTYFLCVASTGFDSTVNERANHMTRPSGEARYVLAMLAELRKFSPIPYRVVIDGELVTADAMVVSLGNGPTFGGGMRICPDADMHDGLLTLLWVHRLSRPRLLRLFPSIFHGRHIEHPEVEQRQVGTVHLAASGQVAYADGERVCPLPIDVTTVPDGVRILVTR